MSILTSVRAVKNAIHGKFTTFVARTDDGLTVKTVQEDRPEQFNISDLMEYITVHQGSLPNKLVSLALGAGAAFAVGMHSCYIVTAIVVSLVFIASSRFTFEIGSTSNLLLIAACSLPEASVTALEYLILLKLLLELVCVAFDKLTQLYAAITADKKHSYYYIWSVFTWLVTLTAINVCPFLNGFVDGFRAGISGM